ncbi:hypothetical protein RJ639_038115 [Escallonia herrerae]|uniref:GrpE protein homolog n=1 Tax=Escallonia herrerae TaxID=1293975 RepID=A0AA89BFF3_9ASTE|nr:hypothetical protein RJ639_038115 [Escallonia herrerae]
MSVSRIATRLSRGVLAQSRNSLLGVSVNHSVLNTSAFQRIGFSSATSHQNNEESGKENNDTAKSSSDSNTDQNGESGSDLEPQANTSRSVKRWRRAPKRTAFSDSDSEIDLSKEDLVKLVAEKENLLKTKQKEIENMHDKVLRTFAKMKNVKDRTTRDAESSKKFAIQSFAKGLLDVMDNLGRASSVVKDRVLKIDTSKDDAGAVQLLKTLLDGVEMTEKQLAEAFKKVGVEKYDPTDENFDPNRHNAVFQVRDPSKPPDTVAVALKSGYLLHDCVIRPAEVGVTVAVDK